MVLSHSLRSGESYPTHQPPRQPQPLSDAEDMPDASEEETIHNIVRVSYYKLHRSSSSLVVLSQSVRRRPNHPSGGLAAPTTTQRIYLDATGGRDKHGVVKKLLSKLRRPSLASSLLVLQHSWRRDPPPAFSAAPKLTLAETQLRIMNTSRRFKATMGEG